MMTTPERPRTTSRINLRRLLPSLVVSILVPILSYTLLRPHVSDVAALAISGCIPTVWTLGSFAWRRRIDPIGVIGVVSTALGLLGLWLSGGSELAAKLPEPVITGLLGLAFVISAVVRRPLTLVAVRMLARDNSGPVTAAGDPAVYRRSTVGSLIIGITLVVHAVVIVIMALALPTARFVALNRPIGLVVLAIGVVVLLTYQRRSTGRSAAPTNIS